MRARSRLSLVLALSLLLSLVGQGSALACGGFFCTTIPVDQSAERIIFAMDEGQITTYVQINYVGSPDNFAWVLPVPSVPKLAPGNMATFTALDFSTRPIFIPPAAPPCLRNRIPLAAPASAAGRSDGVSVLDSGQVGPFDYVVVTSPDPSEMVSWLRDNGYRIDTAMEPLVQVYTDEGMVFLAMKLQPGKGTTDITPIRLEYPGTQPMIPLRLTAVAAQPNMGVLTYVFATGRTASLNYVDMSISDGEIKFSPFGRNDYTQVVERAADQVGGRAFVTEFAGPTSRLANRLNDPTAQMLVQKYPYVTRLYTRISPDEMTEDPVFDLAPGKGDVSNVHDLSRLPAPWSCDDDFNTMKAVGGAGLPPPLADAKRQLERFGSSGTPRGLALASLLAGAAWLAVRRFRPSAGGRPKGRRGLWQVSARASGLLLLEAVVFQGVHEAEHVAQVIQRYVFDVKAANGLLGSLFDLEPVHLAYNLTFLLLLGLAYSACRQTGGVPKRRRLVLALLGIALVGQSYHALEHVAKIFQYFELGRNGTPGLLGQWFSIIWLHFWLNTVIYLPVLAAFFLGGFPRSVGRELGALLPRQAGRRAGPQTV